MIKLLTEVYIRHEPVEAGGYRWPLSMLLTDTFFGIDLEIDLLVFSEFGDEDVVVEDGDMVEFGVVLWDEFDITWVDVGILQVVLWFEAFGL